MNSYQNHRGSSYLSTDPLISSQNIPNEVVHHVQRSQDLLGSTFWSLTWYHQFIKWGLYQKYGTFAKMQDFEMKTLLFERAFRFAGHLGYRYIYIYIIFIYIYRYISYVYIYIIYMLIPPWQTHVSEAIWTHRIDGTLSPHFDPLPALRTPWWKSGGRRQLRAVNVGALRPTNG
jgi:hypothetical protein